MVSRNLCIGIVVTQYTGTGGVETVVRELVQRWKKSGHKVFLITRERRANKAPEEFWDGMLTLPGNYLKYVLSFGRLKKFVNDKEIDILHFHNTSTIFPGLFEPGLMNKSILPLHETTTEVYQNLGNFTWPLMWVFEEIAVNLPAVVTSITEYHLKPFRIWKPVRIIRNGVDLRKFDSNRHSRARSRRKRNLKGKVVLFLGKLVKQKGVRYLLEAARELKDYTVIIAGDGPLRTELEVMAPRNVLFTGRVSDEEKLELYAAADVFVLPSLNEGLPLVLLEAISMGLPVVATDVGGIPEVLEGCIKPRDPKSIVRAVKKAKRQKINRNFDWSDISKKYLDAIRSKVTI